jgi:hypothetical protein
LRASPNYSDRQIAPVYAMRDLYDCAGAGDVAVLKAAFAGKVVLLGAALDVEDRKVISGRAFATAEGGARTLSCAASGNQDGASRRTIPGVFIHAQTINDLLRGDIARFWPLWSVILSLGLLSSAGGGLAMALRVPTASVRSARISPRRNGPPWSTPLATCMAASPSCAGWSSALSKMPPPSKARSGWSISATSSIAVPIPSTFSIISWPARRRAFAASASPAIMRS